jgi:hypothetical protein
MYTSRIVDSIHTDSYGAPPVFFFEGSTEINPIVFFRKINQNGAPFINRDDFPSTTVP